MLTDKLDVNNYMSSEGSYYKKKKNLIKKKQNILVLVNNIYWCIKENNDNIETSCYERQTQNIIIMEHIIATTKKVGHI